MQHKVAQVQVGHVDRVNREIGSAAAGQHVEVGQAVHHHRLNAGEIEHIAVDVDGSRTRSGAARRVGACGHAVAGDAQRVAQRI